MKKVLVAVAVASLTLVSCNKDYTCECTTDWAGTVTTTSIVINDKKGAAKDYCEAKSETVSTIVKTCTIKE
ncbi:MAG: hypothetical protein ACI837_000379 [Crocinitomicaceae bacterium]|jgi:hypothetical protein